MKKIVLPLNPMPDGSCRTVKAQYQQTSLANFIRSGGGVCCYRSNRDCV